METTIKYYIGNIGWSGTAKHMVRVDECNCEKFDGTHSHSDAYAVCKPHLGMHYRIGAVTQLRKVKATAENVTCKQCLEVVKRVKRAK